MKIQKTTNPIHFEDLNPMRFEDLAFNILYRNKNWHSLDHLGRSGNDGGIDIEGIEVVSDTNSKRWLVQCKRYQKFTPSEAEKVVRELRERNPEIANLLLVISCPFSKTGHDRLAQLRAELGLKELIVWTNSNLEAELYHKHPDLLNIYFGVSIGTSFDARLELIQKRMIYRDDLKKKLLKPFDPSVAIIGPKTFHDRKFIIRSVMDDDEETFQDSYEWYSYFSVEPYEIGDIGIQVSFDYQSAYLTEDDEIVLELGSANGKAVKVVKRGHIPYENILTYDLNNGQNRPFFYCIYNGKNGPFDKIEWVIVE